MRRPTLKKLLITLAALAALAVPSVSAAPASAGDDNTALAINTKDGKTVYRIALHVTRNNSEVVTNANVAFAIASCTGCETVAIAFQAVLITDTPSTFTPINLAYAENVLCDSCVTVADAIQIDAQTGGPVKLTPLGQQTLAQIRHDLHTLKQQDLTLDQLICDPRVQPGCDPTTARLNVLAAEFAWVFATQLVPAGS
jgi:hypothetical protein